MKIGFIGCGNMASAMIGGIIKNQVVAPADILASAKTEVSREKKKEELVEKIKDAAVTSTSTEEALDKLDNDEYISNLIQDISDEESSEIKASATRKARINSLSDDIKKKQQ